ncbi:PIN domain-containing protein [Prosthecobacter vanneervenii]|uniref:DUF4935 domain-containing protein n=1 Tax=Prosthecobacter vanneervenii TaxID=48466 RepID=A0A7W8DLJ2_9BACT|nr:PIN domain-containing protein [Prosthecobacter vanneervenii]MBB5034115.1 hypothetical protein [Prosthecobacter vanneervenii]
MFKLLIDTCVWLDMAKDHQQQATIGVLEELVRQKQVTLIVPTIVRDEFTRNKARIVEDSQRSLSSTLKRAKQAVELLGGGKTKRIVLEQLSDLDFRLPSMGESAIESIGRLEKLFDAAEMVGVSDAVKLRAAERALAKKAPFHTQRNSMADAMLMEIYGDMLSAANRGLRFAFVTHNTKDFSHPNADHRLPHPDFSNYFSKIKSLYFIKLTEALKRVQPVMVSDLMMEHEWTEEPRQLSEILDSIEELIDKVWYNRHQIRREKIECGLIKIVAKEAYPARDPRETTIQRDIWEGAKKSARKVEKKYGLENLGPWDDFEWGMINGKLSALRWALGDEWDMLDT